MEAANSTITFGESRQRTAGGAIRGPFMEARVLWGTAIVVVLMVAAQGISTSIGAVTMLGLIAWSVRSRRASVQSLTLGIIVYFMNPGIVSAQPGVSGLKWILLFVAAGSIAIRSRRDDHIPGFIPALGAFSVVAFVASAVASANIILSSLKILTFMIGAVTTVFGFRTERGDENYFASWFLTVHLAVVCASLPLALLPVGYTTNDVGFQGIMNQPQAFAVYLAPMSLVLLCRVAFGRQKLLMIGLTIASLLCLVASKSRTGVLAIIFAAIVAAVAASARSNLRALVLPKIARIGLLLIALILANAAFGVGDQPLEAIREFVIKGSSATNVKSISGVREAAQSRETQIDENLENWRANPVFGVGFGMASAAGVPNVEYDPLFGLPISASTETGFLPLAVLGQSGILGAVVLLAVLAVLFGPIVRYAPLDVLCLALSALFINLGEMIFFATGGLGLEMWLLIGYCYAIARLRRRA